MALFQAAAKAGAPFHVGNLSHDQRADLRLDNGSEILRCHQAPAAAVECENRIGLAGNGLDTVQNAGNIMVFSLIAVVNITVVMIVRGAETKNQTLAALIVLSKNRILQQVLHPVVRALDGKAAALRDRINAQPAVTGADQMLRRDIDAAEILLSDEKISEGRIMPQFFPAYGDVVPPDIPGCEGPGAGRTQKTNDQAVGEDGSVDASALDPAAGIWFTGYADSGDAAPSNAQKALPYDTEALCYGRWWIRTTESVANRFTVCPLWPLGKPSIKEKPIFGLEPKTC